MAWADDTHVLAAVEFRLRRLEWVQTTDAPKQLNLPKPMAHPPYSHEADVESVKMDARASAWQRRQQRSAISD